MKGLDKYIKRHGRHITPELAKAIYGSKWDSSEVERTAQKYVYYNVNGTTLGDMVYISNMLYTYQRWNKRKCIKYTLSKAEDYYNGKEYAFRHLIYFLKSGDLSIDFSLYI